MAGAAQVVTDSATKPLGALVPMAHVADVERSLEWYAKLGFVAEGTLVPEGRPMQWAYLRNGGAQLMLVRSSRPMNPGAQDVLFYLYAQGVAAFREKLKSLGLKPGEISFPPYAAHGEFRIDDPDGYCLLVGDTEQR
ncbi:MAG TPA: VOC family protein [Candidatus Acidoferrales bacterium]|nr:VOC family protein [Candidatus Acidoferrales bacterium]